MGDIFNDNEENRELCPHRPFQLSPVGTRSPQPQPWPPSVVWKDAVGSPYPLLDWQLQARALASAPGHPGAAFSHRCSLVLLHWPELGITINS